ncbi:MAG: acyltransferase, partial [Mastigocladus sp. ERB_26_2]
MSEINAKQSERKIHLLYLDGIRGIAALFVLLYHLMYQIQGYETEWSNLLNKLLRYGFLGVPVFIVLSGYCLMLPVVRSGNGYISGTLVDFFWRRAKRIIPPYYATIILCSLISLAIIGLEKFTNFNWNVRQWDWFSPDFSLIDVILHLLLIHNFASEQQAFSISTPLWSVAVEWQIYFLFPLLLLPIWRRWGCKAVISIATLIGLGSLYLFDGFLSHSRMYFLISFSIGMLAADISFSEKPKLVWMRKSLPLQLLVIIFFALSILTEWEKFALPEWLCSICASIAAASLMVYCTNFLMEGKKLPIVIKILESPVALALGSFSYSLYLTHALVITLMRHFLLNFQLSPNIFVVLPQILHLETWMSKPQLRARWARCSI